MNPIPLAPHRTTRPPAPFVTTILGLLMALLSLGVLEGDRASSVSCCSHDVGELAGERSDADPEQDGDPDDDDLARAEGEDLGDSSSQGSHGRRWYDPDGAVGYRARLFRPPISARV